MEFLLKIVEGPMKGAEIALVAGSRVKLGSGDDCDIVVADQSMPSVACELDVSESSVTCVGADGEAKELAPFVVVSFGETAVAVGPAEGVWEELKRPDDSAPDADAGDAAPDAPHAADASAEGEDVGEVVGRRPRGEDASDAEPARRRTGLVVAVIVLFVLVVLAVLAWLFWPQAKSWCDSHLTRRAAASATVVASAPTLADIAEQHGLALTNYPQSSIHHPLLKGNLRRRTERLAIRAMALAADPMVKFDLTDDETLCASANELLFVVTEGQLTATAASNRVVTLAGYAPTAASLERSVRALNADVPGIERLVTKAVQVGGVPPKTAAAVATPEAPRPAGAAKKRPVAQDYPLAGILTRPYPCVVMRSGMRLTEGAQVGNVVIEKIEVDKLTLRDGKTTVVWKP